MLGAEIKYPYNKKRYADGLAKHLTVGLDCAAGINVKDKRPYLCGSVSVVGGSGHYQCGLNFFCRCL